MRTYKIADYSCYRQVLLFCHFFSKNFLKFDVYFSDLTVEHIDTQPSYQTLDLISDLGGQAGLWVGVSMIAFFEFIELIMDICIVCAKRYVGGTKCMYFFTATYH